MAGRQSLSSKPPSTPSSASKQVLVDNDLRRISFHQTIALGAFYDVRTESIVDRLSLNAKIITESVQSKETQCEVLTADEIDHEDILRKVGIDQESWLNAVLDHGPSQGMLALINYSFPKSPNIRLLYYYYTSKDQAISSVKNSVMAYISKDTPTISATHIVSAVKLGIQVLVVLEVPVASSIDLIRALESAAEQLSKNKFQTSSNQKSLLNQIIVRKVFSNIPALVDTSNLTQICQKLVDIKPHPFRHCSLEFTLRTIKWFYPLYPNEKARYIALEPEIVKTISQYLLMFSAKTNELKSAFNAQNKKMLEEHVRKQYETFQ